MTTPSSSNLIAFKRSTLLLIIIILIVIGVIIGYIVFKTNSQSPFAGSPGYEKPFAEIPIHTAKENVDYYQKTVTTQYDGNTLGNTKSVHFDLDPLGKYLETIKQEQGATGVRVYFARHKKDTIVHSKNFKHYGTIIFVATRKDLNGKTVDIVGNIGGKLIQPYNGGISCPPLPPNYCGSESL